jgi:hypothetical protein
MKLEWKNTDKNEFMNQESEVGNASKSFVNQKN